MKKIISLLAAVFSLSLSAQAAHVGSGAGYLVDNEEVYFSVRGGLTLKSTASILHLAELELGYTESSSSGVSLDVLPLFANYRAELSTTTKFGTHFGIGAGAVRVKLGGFGISDTSTGFAAQTFLGLNYKVTSKASINAGVRYLWFGDVELFGIKDRLGDDVAVEVGFSLKF